MQISAPLQMILQHETQPRYSPEYANWNLWQLQKHVPIESWISVSPPPPNAGPCQNIDCLNWDRSHWQLLFEAHVHLDLFDWIIFWFSGPIRRDKLVFRIFNRPHLRDIARGDWLYNWSPEQSQALEQFQSQRLEQMKLRSYPAWLNVQWVVWPILGTLFLPRWRVISHPAQFSLWSSYVKSRTQPHSESAQPFRHSIPDMCGMLVISFPWRHYPVLLDT